MAESIDTAPRELLALEKALDRAELRYQSALAEERKRTGQARVIAAEFTRRHRAHREDLRRQLKQLREVTR